MRRSPRPRLPTKRPSRRSARGLSNGSSPIMLPSMTLIDGKAIAQKTHAANKVAVAALKARGVTPGLAVVLVGDDPASRAYVRSKDRMCLELGMHSVKHELPANTTESDLIALIMSLNADPAIHGILVQSP